MATNVQVCAAKGCKTKLENGFRMALMMGPNGYRRYAVCQKCAEKLGLGKPQRGGRQRAAAQVQREAISEGR